MIDPALLTIETRLIRLRPATQDDVPLIFALRRSERGSWLNPTSPDIADQYRYFSSYEQRFRVGDEIYFVMEDKRQSRDAGVTRVTRIRESERFGWEGLIIDSNATPGCAIDLTLAVYAWGFNRAAKQICGPWGVLKNHSRVNRLHAAMGIAEIVGEDEKYWFYEVRAERFRERYPALAKRGLGMIVD